jgi:histone deacetylase 1/2
LYKSRLVIRGDLAVAGFDYFETYSPVAKIDSIRLILAIIITHKFIPAQYDIGNAYIQSVLKELVYISAIPGIPLPLGKCYKLLRSLYGLPQAGRNWNMLIDTDFIELGFIKIREDLCVYVLFVNGELVACAVLYIDDVIAGFDSAEREEWFRNALAGKYKTKAIGLPSNVIGLAVTWEPIPDKPYFRNVHIVNAKSVNVLAEKLELVGAKSVKLPYNLANKLSKSQGPTDTQLLCPEVKLMQSDYRSLVGTFIWLTVTTRVDIISIVLILSQFVSNPAYQHYQAALWLVKYLIGTIDLGITYHMDGDPNIVGYVDADHASHESRRSVYSYIFMYAGGPIFWKNGFENRFSLSTGESEVRAVYALREAIKHVLYLKKVIKSLLLEDMADKATIAMTQLPTAVFEDNMAAIRFSLNPASQSTMKYLEVDILWIHDSIERGEFTLIHIDSIKQLADIGTKLNSAEIFYQLRSQLMN